MHRLHVPYWTPYGTISLQLSTVMVSQISKRVIYRFASRRSAVLLSESFMMEILRCLRFHLLDFFVRMCRIPAGLYLTFPVPVSEKRFFAPEWVFILGIGSLYYLIL